MGWELAARDGCGGIDDDFADAGLRDLTLDRWGGWAPFGQRLGALLFQPPLVRGSLDNLLDAIAAMREGLVMLEARCARRMADDSDRVAAWAGAEPSKAAKVAPAAPGEAPRKRGRPKAVSPGLATRERDPTRERDQRRGVPEVSPPLFPHAPAVAAEDAP
jgi:hypothetical protein